MSKCFMIYGPIRPPAGRIGFFVAFTTESTTLQKEESQARIQGGRRAPLPHWSSEGRATIWLNNCENSLNTSFKYIIIIIHNYKNYKQKSYSGPLRIFSDGAGAKIIQ